MSTEIYFQNYHAKNGTAYWLIDAIKVALLVCIPSHHIYIHQQ